jgi:hypothetical protein
MKMKTMKLFAFLFAITVLAMFAGCSKDDDTSSVTESFDYKAPALGTNGKVIEVPTKLSQNKDSHAQQCAGYLEMANGISQSFSSFALPSNATRVSLKTGSVTYTWSGPDGKGNTATVWVTYKETDTKYFWDYELAYDSIPRTLYMHAESAKDSKSGMLQILDVYKSGASGTYTWTTASDGTFNFTWDAKNATESFKMEIIVKTDKSGSLKYYSNGKVFYDLKWNADGSGSWTLYGDNGNLSGNWSA